MIEYRKASKDDLKAIAEFISVINAKEEHHIGYCGTEAGEIADTLVNDFTDTPFSDCFILTIKEGKAIGVLGFDVDLNLGIAELWGPFIDEGFWYIAEGLWNRSLDILPEGVKQLHLFVNQKNANAIKWGEFLDFSRNSEESILQIDRDNQKLQEDIVLTELSAEYYKEMATLHDIAFPNTYCRGEEIISGLNEVNKVFIITNETQLLGYIYAEVKTEHQEASIEFFAVNQMNRGKGLGAILLKMALKWIFSFPMIDNISLCVNSQNHKAIKLYKGVGFQEKHLLYLCKKEISIK